MDTVSCRFELRETITDVNKSTMMILFPGGEIRILLGRRCCSRFYDRGDKHGRPVSLKALDSTSWLEPPKTLENIVIHLFVP